MLNNVTLMGRLTADPELRHTGNDIAVSSFTLAVERDYAKAGTERQADFIGIVCWRGTAEFVQKYFRKGQLVAVEGSIQTRSYTDSQGIKRKAFEVLARAVHFAESKKQGAAENTGTVPVAQQPEANEDFVEISPNDDLPF